MPTSRPRHMITESDRLAGALGLAAELWPEASGDRGALVKRILEAGIEAIEVRQERHTNERHAAITELAGTMTGVWPAGWRDELRDEWPE
ncbi:MAG: hypothetical protein WD400_04565 [Pontimonas sp.]